MYTPTGLPKSESKRNLLSLNEITERLMIDTHTTRAFHYRICF